MEYYKFKVETPDSIFSVISDDIKKVASEVLVGESGFAIRCVGMQYYEAINDQQWHMKITQVGYIVPEVREAFTTIFNALLAQGASTEAATSYVNKGMIGFLERIQDE